MTILGKFLVHYGIWILLLYLSGLLARNALYEGITQTFFWAITLSYVGCFIIANWPVSRPKINWIALGIWAISLTLLLPLALRGDHILGVDTHREFYAFMQSDLNNEVYTWDGGLVASCLSVTILPVIFQDVTSIEHEVLFKILYPILFSVFPVIVYLIARRFMAVGWAVLSGLTITLQPMFLWTTANARTSLGVLFIALFLLVMFSDVRDGSKFIYITLLGVGCALSHYMSAVVLLVLLATFLLFKGYRTVTFFSLSIIAAVTLTWQVSSGLENHYWFLQ